MTPDELREAVARLVDEWPNRSQYAIAQDVIALIRADVLEEAARVVEATPFEFKIIGAPPGSIEVVDTSKTIAAAIRALKEKSE